MFIKMPSGKKPAGADSLAIEASLRLPPFECEGALAVPWRFLKRGSDESLVLQLIAFHPDWEKPPQIGYFRSPAKTASGPALECDFEHKSGRRSDGSAR